jgi:Holliday junction resolvasome RuvABC ATP-dependent DNA helicase subunit
MSFSPEDPPTGTEFIEQTLSAPENAEESQLRPLSFDDFAGQDKTLERLRVMVGAARDREEALNHILLSGPPGLGVRPSLVSKFLPQRTNHTGGMIEDEFSAKIAVFLAFNLSMP